MSSQGPNYAGAGADNAGVGTVAWSNPGNVTASDDTRAVAALLAGATSHYLVATNFGFSIPSGATIDGIEVSWERSTATGIDDTQDARIRIVKGGAVGATDKSIAGTWPTFDGVHTYGSAADLWGETWTDADVNASNFGAALACSAPAAGGSAQVDAVQVTVYYTAAAPGQLPGRVAVARRVEAPTEPQFAE